MRQATHRIHSQQREGHFVVAQMPQQLAGRATAAAEGTVTGAGVDAAGLRGRSGVGGWWREVVQEAAAAEARGAASRVELAREGRDVLTEQVPDTHTTKFFSTIHK